MKKITYFVLGLVLFLGVGIAGVKAAPMCHPEVWADCSQGGATVEGDWRAYTMKFYVDENLIKTFWNVYPGESRTVNWADYSWINLSQTHVFRARLVGYESRSVEFGSCPTAVGVGSFTVRPWGRNALLSWETASEINTLGFNIYRATPGMEWRERLNGQIIPAKNPGSPCGASYSFVDEYVTLGRNYLYWLEEVSTTGGIELYGPVKFGWGRYGVKR